MRRGTWLTTTGAAALMAAMLPALPASAATDHTPPSLTVIPHAAFAQGRIIGPSDPPTPDQETFVPSIPMFITWHGSDASGICGYDVKEDYAGAPPQTVVSGTRSTRYNGTATDYDDQYGGGSEKVVGWIVTAHDCAGNTTSRESELLPSVTQENGYSPDERGKIPTIAYSGTWGTSYCTCWSAGAVRRTTQKGARATITYDNYAVGTAVGLVMEKAPNRGKFTLLIDGVNRGSVDTYAASPTHRVIVWSGRLSSAGRHVIQLVNQATAGRGRIDLDAVLLN